MNYQDYVVQDSKFLRPEELKYLRGDCSKLKKTFDWKPEYTFETLMDNMTAVFLYKELFNIYGEQKMLSILPSVNNVEEHSVENVLIAYNNLTN